MMFRTAIIAGSASPRLNCASASFRSLATPIITLGSSASVKARRPGAADEVERRGGEIDEAHGALPCLRRDSVACPDDPGNAERRVVREHAVRPFAVFAQAFAVIGGEDDQRRVELVRGVEIGDEV